MKAEEMRKLSVKEIDEQILEKRKEQMNLRFQKSSGQLKDSSQVRTTRRTISRLKTIRTELEGAQS